MTSHPRKRNHGFTMIELLVTMVILGILASIVGMNVTASQAKARDARRKSDLASISKALEVYYNDFERYPAASGGQITGAPWGGTLATVNNVYMSQVPQDPKTHEYYYETDASGTEFRLFAILENPRDPDLNLSGSTILTYSATDCGTGECNYGVSSSNTSPETGHVLH